MARLTKLGLNRSEPSSAEAGRIRTRNVLHPLLWLTFLTTPVCVIVSLFASPPINYFAIALAAFPPTIVALSFLGFAFFDADRLQSEDFALQKQWFAAQIGDNDTKEVITLEGEAAAPRPNLGLTDGRNG